MKKDLDALELADLLDAYPYKHAQLAANELRRLYDLYYDCDRFLLDGETPEKRIMREQALVEKLMLGINQQRKQKAELIKALRQTCKALGNEHPDAIVAKEVIACVVDETLMF